MSFSNRARQAIKQKNFEEASRNSENAMITASTAIAVGIILLALYIIVRVVPVVSSSGH